MADDSGDSSALARQADVPIIRFAPLAIWRGIPQSRNGVIAACLLCAAVTAVIEQSCHGWTGSALGACLSQALALVKPFGKVDVVVALVFAAGALGWRRSAERSLIALLIAGAIVGPLKPLIARERPNGFIHSCPSGDVATITAAVGPFARVFPGPASALVALVSVERIAQGKHWPSDVLLSIVIGLLATGAAGQVRFPRRPWSRRVFASAARLTIGVVIVDALNDGNGPQETFLLTWAPGLLLAFTSGWIARLVESTPAQDAACDR